VYVDSLDAWFYVFIDTLKYFGLKALKKEEFSRKLKVKPKNAILVGDTSNDMVAGEKAGCVTIGYKIKRDNKIDNLSEALNLLK